jgi:hypothetical protein
MRVRAQGTNARELGSDQAPKQARGAEIVGDASPCVFGTLASERSQGQKSWPEERKRTLYTDR